MGTLLKSYDMELITVGPLYVGSGETIQKKSYIYRQGRVLVPDLEKMCAGLRKKNLERQFFEFLMSPADTRPLGKWFTDSRVPMTEVMPWIRYTLDGGDRLRDGKPPAEIHCFQKDTYGNPYIPGSSIKGMLRTILLGAELIEHPEKCKGLREELPRTIRENEKPRRNIFLQREQRATENEILHTLHRTDKNGKPVPMDNAVNDGLSGLIVGDSEPLKLTDLTLCQKLDLHRDGTFNCLNILRESIMPRKAIRFKITLDQSLCPYTMEKIQKAVDVFADAYYDMFLSAFRGIDRPKEATIWLGGGVGFFNKTILYPCLDEYEGKKAAVEVFRRTLPPRIFIEHGHHRDLNIGVSPHVCKCTDYQGHTYQFGECLLRVKKEYDL